MPTLKPNKYLQAYVAQRNAYAAIFGDQVLPADPSRWTPEQRTKVLDDLDNELSPENLCCDGELSGRALLQKAAMLNGALKALQ